LALLLITSTMFRWVELPGGGQRFSLVTTIYGYYLTILVILASGVCYPFYRYRYARVSRQEGDETGKAACGKSALR
jgi:hypothetical protein